MNPVRNNELGATPAVLASDKPRSISNGVKRVLIFSLTYHPFVGGAEVAIKEITDRMDPKEYCFDMITLRFDRNVPKVEKIGNVTVHRIGFTADSPKVSDRQMPFQLRIAKLFFPFTAYLKATKLHRKNHYDFTWAMMANYAAFGALFFKYTHPHIPYLLELQDGNTLEQVKERRPAVRLLWWLYKNIYLKADIIKAISHFIEKLTREVGYTGNVVVIPNGVDVAKFSAQISEEKLTALKTKLDKQPGDVFLFTASRLVLSRGVEDVIRALTYLPPHVKFLIAGDGEDRAKLDAIAKEERVHSRILFLGHVDHAELPLYFKISDIFVRPSLIEGFGSAFVEAFAAGIPVIATPVGGIPDFLFDPDRQPEGQAGNPQRPPTGLFCEVQNPESIARTVTHYLENPALTAKIVANAKNLVAEKYDWNFIAKDMQNLIFQKL
jgi:glycosyltransferase involved in cell wall biosynthesis